MSRSLNKLVVLFILITIILSPLPLTSSPTSSTNIIEDNEFWKHKVDPILLNENYYTMEFMKKIGLNLSIELPLDKVPKISSYKIREGQVKIAIVASKDINLDYLARFTHGIIFGKRLPGFTYVEAWATYEDVVRLAKLPFVFKIIAVRSPVAQLLNEKLLAKGSEYRELDLYAAVDVLGATKVWEEYNITGKGIKVAVVDTGVDFGMSDFGAEAIARDEHGLPLIFDSDEIGLVLTLTTAVKDEEGYINIEEPVMYFDWFSMEIGSTYYGWAFAYGPEGACFALYPLQRFYVGNIHSYNNVFKFGIAVQTVYAQYGGAGILWYTVPVILADVNDDGYYDTLYADLSTAFYYIALCMNATGMAVSSIDPSWRDFSFEDEKPAYYGSEDIGRDFNGDGINDFSIGAIAGYMYDWLGIFTGPVEYYGWDRFWEAGAYILPGLDPGGYYVSIAYDWLGHGTSCAGVIASRGRVAYDLGYGEYKLRGIAPEAKIASAPGYLLNAFTAEFFFAGFTPVGAPWNWTYTGEHQVHVISNSWGVSYIALIGFASALDPWSIMEDYIVATSGTVIVHAMGNGGPGYGTVTMPGSGSLVISVGASTLFEYRILYGYLPGPGGEVVSWSDRGPTNIGTVKPDVVNIGSFAWAPAPWHFGLGNGVYAYDLFGGTSEATPMTSGSVALLIQAYMSKFGERPSPGVVKTILKSAAKDLGYDPFTQGSGHVDIYTAVKSIIEGGLPRVYSYDTFNNVEPFLDDETLGYDLAAVEDTQLYAGVMYPGETKELKLYIEGDGTYELEPVTFEVERESLLPYLDLDKAIAYTPAGAIPLSELIVNVTEDTLVLNISYPAISHILIPVSSDAYSDSDLVTFIASMPYSIFDPYGREGVYSAPFYLGPWVYAGVDLHYWIDIDGDGVATMSQTARINYDIRAANNFHVTFGYPLTKISEIEKRVNDFIEGIPEGVEKAVLLDIRIYRNAYYYTNGWVLVPFKLEILKTKRVTWDWVTVPETGSGEVSVTINIPENAKPGVYQGYIIVKGGLKDVLVPVSVVVNARIDESTSVIELKGSAEDRLYENYLVEGQFDWTWRYESGDWRTFAIDVEDSSVIGLIVTVYWKGYNTNIDLAVAGKYSPYPLAGEPDIEYYGSIGAAKLTLYLYRSGWGTHYDRPAPRMAVIYVPISSPGIYWVLVRNTLIDAEKYYPEPIRVTIRPVRVSEKELTIELGGEATASAELTIWGSYALSNAYISAYTVSGDAVIQVEPRLGFGNEHTITLEVSATQESYAVLLIMLDGYPQYSIGLTVAGLRSAAEIPAVIAIPIHIIP